MELEEVEVMVEKEVEVESESKVEVISWSCAARSRRAHRETNGSGSPAVCLRTARGAIRRTTEPR